MNGISNSILLILVGLSFGTLIMVILNKLKITSAQKDADKFLENAKKEAEKIKRDNILESQEENYKLKQEV